MNVDAAVDFIRAFQKKIEFIENHPRPVSAPAARVVLCEISSVTALVTGSACPSCREQKLLVREVAEKRKRLSDFLELCCENVECLESTLSSTHTSRRTTSAGDPGANVCYDSGNSRDSFAVNGKAVVGTRAIGAGHNQLSQFCAIVGLPSPMHHKTFIGTYLQKTPWCCQEGCEPKLGIGSKCHKGRSRQ